MLGKAGLKVSGLPVGSYPFCWGLSIFMAIGSKAQAEVTNKKGYGMSLIVLDFRRHHF